MPRQAREKSKSGIYHIMIRGNGRKEIFHDNQDYIKFLNILKKIKNKFDLKVYGWCLMGNHAHLLLEEGNEDISMSMRRLGVSYVGYYNKKYDTIGHLFQDRFKSEKVEDDQYLLTVIRYIHQNPVRANIVKRESDWGWSSCQRYYSEESVTELLNKDFILNMFSQNRDKAIKNFKFFNEQKNEDECLDYTEKLKLSDKEAEEQVRNAIKEFGIELAEIKSLPKTKRTEALRKIKDIEGLTYRQTARIIGISPSIIFKSK